MRMEAVVGSDGDDDHSWSDLPGLPLHAISSRMDTPADFSSFRRACSSWRAASARPRDFMAAQPPWLCSAGYDRLYSLQSRHFYVRAAATGGAGKGDGGRDKRFAVGFSSGSLILADPGRRLYLADPLTGSETHSFTCPPRTFSRALCLPAPPAGTFLVVFDSGAMQYCRAGEEEWAVHVFDENDGTGPVRNMTAFDGKLFALTTQGRLWAADIAAGSPPAPVFLEEDEEEEGWSSSLPFGRFQGTWLGEAGGELLGITCDYKFTEPRGVARFAVRRFDFARRRWAGGDGAGEEESPLLAGRCLLLDMSWGVLSDGDPARWGGRAGAVYFTDPMRNAVRVFDVKGGNVEDLAAPTTGRAGGGDGFRWEMFVWVVPNLCC